MLVKMKPLSISSLERPLADVCIALRNLTEELSATTAMEEGSTHPSPALRDYLHDFYMFLSAVYEASCASERATWGPSLQYHWAAHWGASPFAQKQEQPTPKGDASPRSAGPNYPPPWTED